MLINGVQYKDSPISVIRCKSNYWSAEVLERKEALNNAKAFAGFLRYVPSVGEVIRIEMAVSKKNPNYCRQACALAMQTLNVILAAYGTIPMTVIDTKNKGITIVK